MDKAARAMMHGYVVKYWLLEDYLRDAIDNQGWESLVFWGVKGSGKSNFLLQLLYAIYKDWDTALKYLIMSPMELIVILDNLDVKERIPLLVWDDMVAHLPSTLYFTDRKLYESIKKNWQTNRTRFNVFICTTPLKSQLCNFVLDDITGELFFDKRVGSDLKGKFDFQRHCWSIDWKHPKKERFEMVRVEYTDFPYTPEMAEPIRQLEIARAEQEERKPRKYPLEGVPFDVFTKYWDRRLVLAKASEEEIKKAFRKLIEKTKEQEPLPPSALSNAGKMLVQAREQKKHS